MKDKHINNPADNALLAFIHKEVKRRLKDDTLLVTTRLWLKFIFYISLVLFTYTGILFAENPYTFFACYLLYGTFLLLFAFNFAHDFSHSTVFRSRRWNNIGFILIYTMNGAHAESWKHRHIHSHHFAPNVEEYDSDLQITQLIRVTPESRRRWFHRFQHIYAPVLYTSYSLYWIFIKDFVLLFKEKRMVAYYLSFVLQKAFYISYLLVIPLLLSSHNTWLVLSAFIVMHLFQSLFLLFTFFMTHHVESTSYFTTDDEGLIHSSWLMNQVKSSNDMYPFSRAANFIFGGFNNHVAHHLFPNIHHIHYPKLSEILYEILESRGIRPNQTTYFGGILSHLRLLRKMGVT